MQHVDYSSLPEHMVDATRRYIEDGIHPGSFLTAVICNELSEAFMYADDINKTFMFEWVKFFYNNVPSVCYGSYETMKAWIKIGGLKGLELQSYEDKEETE